MYLSGLRRKLWRKYSISRFLIGFLEPFGAAGADQDNNSSIFRSSWTRGWAAEPTRRWWWFPRAPWSRCWSSAAAGSWRCPRHTSAAGNTGSAFQTNSPGCSAREFRKKIRWVNSHTVNRCCSFIPLRCLTHVSNKVLLPHYEIDDPSKGSRSFRQERPFKSTLHQHFDLDSWTNSLYYTTASGFFKCQ